MSKFDLTQKYHAQPTVSPRPTLGTIELLGVNIHTLRRDELLERIANVIAARQRAIVAYANVHALNLAYDQPWFRAFLNQSDLVFCDGFGVKWGARLVGSRLPERFTPPDWIARLIEIACRDDFSVFMIGAQVGVTERLAAQFKQRFPQLKIAGTHHGYFDKTPGSAENEAVIQAINAAKPNVLMVGFGMPVQERWLLDNWARLDANVALTAGAAFDYMAGEVRRAPRWMTDHGLEWLGRLVIEPRRLWRRYIVGNPLFLWRVIEQRLGHLHFDDSQ
jgi:N-acetylglucosaminyldiphosphoundecaprenol N-acetyl-beta-D-mannosaminyltransferase